MKRRDFIISSGAAVAVPIILNGIPIQTNASPIFEKYALSGENEDRILIIVQLVGGNDGLNTMIPLDQYENLNKNRKNILLPENSLLNISDKNALHPAMTAFKKLWDNEKLEVLQNVGYPNQNFSHFRSTDIWTSASDYNKFESSGWLGRYFSDRHPDYPTNYPNSQNPDPLSISVGNVVSQTCQGPIYSMGMAVNDIKNFYNLNNSDVNNQIDGYPGDELQYVRGIMNQTQVYLDVLETAANKGSINASLWAGQDNNKLSNQLKIVAQLINGGLKTKVYVCSLGGFDTHSAQVDTTDVENGTHATLLANLADAIASFQAQIEEYGIADKILGMTFSEFGRRIISNNSLGTDHGSAAPQFLFGTQVNNTIHGSNPIIPDAAAPNDNLDYEIDFRSLYSSVLKDWFGVQDQELIKIMFKEFEHINILKSSTSVENNIADYFYSAKIFTNYPNPINSYTNLDFYTEDSHIKIDLFDSDGNFVKPLIEKYFSKGRHSVRIDNFNNKSGAYFIKLKNHKEECFHKVIVN